MRAHFEGRLRVEIRSDRGASTILVRRGDAPLREERVAVSPADARETADALVREAFPHTCANADCGEWVEVGPR